MAVTSPSQAYSYDVFLNFRGSDTRQGFTGFLYKALLDSGIHIFIDDEGIQSGKIITPELKEAIEKSRIAITVLSTNYASSSFCLDELEIILDCFKRTKLLVLPVFYKVPPSHVRHQQGSYGEALARLEEGLHHKMKNWKKALKKVANHSGFHFEDDRKEYEHKLIEKIVERVFSIISNVEERLHVADYPVGLESQVHEIRKLLDVGDDDGVNMIGIHGMGGVGKSALARRVYNLITHQFEGSCFLQNVREESNKHGLKHLQSIILSQVLGMKEINLASEQQGISIIKNRLKRKKVLLILDDVDKHKQLHGIVGSPEWFGPGSVVIITTRDKQLLASHEVKRTHEVKELNEIDALKLLKFKAFKMEEVDPSYDEVLNQVVTYASGIPLALEVIGSNLFGKSVQEWESAIKQYKRIPNNKILEILKVSFDSLGEEEKSVFLDIACCFKGYKLTEIEEKLRALYDNCMKYHIGVLVEKSLIKFSHDERVTFHDLIEDMGKRIDRQQSPREPGKRRRLWLQEDIIQVLKDKSGTSEIKIICLHFSISDDQVVEWDGNAFTDMKSLKILIVRNGIFSQIWNHLPEGLKVLEWRAQVVANGCITSLEYGRLSKASLKNTFYSCCK
ncbi:disease resistance protein Roq1-like isoform X1 [Vigna angularis]|uniref:disease resistance protein Roq1-like isoform X1 n=1 Tax=Phaseolus angularis TaxID=3914 RepID=UPI000809C31B|nr:disease resistance protein Roq1-like isoform X1 [Vigna angularis]